MNILQKNEAIFLNENQANPFLDVLIRLTDRKDIHIADDKRFISSSGFVMRKQLSNVFKEIIDLMYTKMKSSNLTN